MSSLLIAIILLVCIHVLGIFEMIVCDWGIFTSSLYKAIDSEDLKPYFSNLVDNKIQNRKLKGRNTYLRCAGGNRADARWYGRFRTSIQTVWIATLEIRWRLLLLWSRMTILLWTAAGIRSRYRVTRTAHSGWSHARQWFALKRTRLTT